MKVGKLHVNKQIILYFYFITLLLFNKIANSILRKSTSIILFKVSKDIVNLIWGIFQCIALVRLLSPIKELTLHGRSRHYHWLV